MNPKDIERYNSLLSMAALGLVEAESEKNTAGLYDYLSDVAEGTENPILSAFVFFYRFHAERQAFEEEFDELIAYGYSADELDALEAGDLDEG